MADIRKLMAQEQQSRRINHEYSSYSRTGALMCTACQLNVRSEALWDGHLRSANHKANVKKIQQAPRSTVKRKIDDVEEANATEGPDSRKKLKPKSRTPSETVIVPTESQQPLPEIPSKLDTPVVVSSLDGNTVTKPSPQPKKHTTVPIDAARIQPIQPAQPVAAQVDEDEWAAFERDVAPLAQADYSSATITAAPVSAAQIEAEAELDRKRLRDTEAEDEKEDAGRRIEEEFEVMEEMEERVRKLKEKREALRQMGANHMDTGQGDSAGLNTAEDPTIAEDEENEADDSEEDMDDWYS